MAVTAQSVISEMLVNLSDPLVKRLTFGDGLLFLNQVARDLARKLKCKEYVAYFNTMDTDAYQLPDDCIVETALWWSSSPSDPSTYRKLREMQKSEFEAATNGSYPAGDPDAYYMRAGFFHLFPMPDRESALAGKIDYYGLPDRVESVTDNITIADYLRDALREGMQIMAREKLEEVDPGSYQSWVASIPDQREDRSRDRRPNLRLSSGWTGGAV